ncbi:MAG: hypothetical protein FIB01_08385 [Gemmatimonadetes bacterium]|nr:hypothetical protein [Gemmatimonadota bacterium]
MNGKSDFAGIDRRDFVRRMTALAAGAGALGATRAAAEAGQESSSPETSPAVRIPPDTVIGIQMGPHTALDEDIAPCLDLLRETAAIDTLLIYSHAFHTGNLRKPRQFLADHGAPLKAAPARVPQVWVRHHEQYFRNTALRVRAPDPSLEYASRDLFEEVQKPARERGMKVYARILESSGASIVGVDDGRTIDVQGRPQPVGCGRHPDYREFWAAVAEDLFRSYDLDGFQWGAERMGPLMNVILPWNDRPPTCFCPHCVAHGRAQGIDPERARAGYEGLFTWTRALIAGGPRPADGVFTGFLRHLLRYPEILAWEYQYRLGREAVMKAMYERIKAVKPGALVGWHVDHQPSSWDLVYRAELSYEDMAPYSDFIKFIAYHDVLGPRIRYWYLDRFRSTILGELSLEQSLELYYALFGYDPAREPALAELATKGMSPDYVYRETRRSVASANGKTRIWPGIGFDVPWGDATMVGDPEEIYQATVKAFEAGASGIVVSREYEELRLENLRAVGRAVRQLQA